MCSINPLGGCAGRKLDIAILGDRSRSLKPSDLARFRQVVANMVARVGVSPDGNHFGIVTFGPSAVSYNNFKDGIYHNKAKLLELLRQKFGSIAKTVGTRTDKALKLARDKLFNRGNGDRRDAANLLFLFTDGKPTGHRLKDFTPFKGLTEGLEVSFLCALQLKVHSTLNSDSPSDTSPIKLEACEICVCNVFLVIQVSCSSGFHISSCRFN